ncbi:MAG: hypothetical protein CVT80_00560 [Alphaproteobacteria bacterium HGW-Alphaproteobacteria-2]|nr:MAG: hypothetical protein CVT80_00560 [Alphaproteobacteria bacterium HGW-Alphaproteobacteria-2]
MTLGIIGVGHLAAAILRGLVRAGQPAEGVILSPRGQGPDLAARHGFLLAADNADLVRRADIVLLAVRPADAEAALRGLPWRAEHTLASACAGVSLARLVDAAAPARVVRIMPITAAQLGASPTLVHPMRPELEPLLHAIGSVIALPDEGRFEAATVSAAIYGWVQALIRESAAWAGAEGLDPGTARALMARTFIAAGRLADETDTPLDALIDTIATPGGITEAGLIHLRDRGTPEAWQGACDVVLRKLHGDS